MGRLVRADRQAKGRLTRDTIFALSSGQPPAAIAVVRLSGPNATAALAALTSLPPPPPRQAALRRLVYQGSELDTALVLRFEAGASATGEDLVELHLHGGRATVQAVLHALAALPGLRPAEPGEFTRRALLNGCMDLGEVEGLADLLEAETEVQRRSALRRAEGGFRQTVEGWRSELLAASARIEAAIDFADEDDVVPFENRAPVLEHLAARIELVLANPPAERIRDGLRVVIAGPPNSGKSSLINALAGRPVALVADVAGTTRDRIEAPLMLAGYPFVLTDTAGIRDTSDVVEAAGVALAHEALVGADLVLWLGPPAERPPGALQLAARADLYEGGEGLRLSVKTGEGLDDLRAQLITAARNTLGDGSALSTTLCQRQQLVEIVHELRQGALAELLLAAEHLRRARQLLDTLSGRADTEAMLDALFSRFCIGK